MRSAGTIPQLDAEALRKPLGKPAVQRPQPVLVKLSNVKARQVDWLWPGRFAKNTIGIVVGPPGKGKSYVAHDISARVTTGRPWPNAADTRPREPASVVLLACEDDPAMVLRPRLEMLGADLDRITLLKGVRDEQGQERFFTLDGDLPRLREAIEATPECGLVMIDPIAPLMGRRCDGNSHSDVYASLYPLIEVAESYGVAMILVQHTNKSLSPSALGRLMGSVAWSGIARNTWFVTPDPDNRTNRLFLHGKANLGPLSTGLRFTISQDGTFAWLPGTVDQSADEQFEREAETARRGPEPEQRDDAGRWLLELLAAGPTDVQEIRQQADAAGLVWVTIKRAKAELGIQSVKGNFGAGWRWQLPPTDDDTSDNSAGEPPIALEPDPLDTLRENTPRVSSFPILRDTLRLARSESQGYQEDQVNLVRKGDTLRPDDDSGCPIGESVPDEVRFANIPEPVRAVADEWGEE